MITNLTIDKLLVDYSYQRDLDSKRANKIAKDFMPELLGSILVSKRNDGSFYIIDGNHRVNAAKIVGEKMIPATIIRGLSVEEEAELFHKSNVGQKKTTYNENLKASITAGNDTAVNYKRVLDESGIKYSFGNSGKNFELVAHRTGIETIKAYGEKIFIESVQIISSANQRMDSRLIKGLALFLTYPGIDRKRIERIIMINPFDEFLRTMSHYDYRANGGASKLRGTGMAKGLAELYNKGLKTHRIDLSFFDKGGAK